MALPKKKQTRARRGNRKAHNALKLAQLVPCQRCKTMISSHQACSNCGTYKGRDVIPLKSKSKTALKEVKTSDKKESKEEKK